MTTYIAFLRGINVGGKNMIKMALLKKMFETMGFLHVQTYIQSGNVVFKSDELEATLLGRIENEIETVFGFSVPVMLRTAAELEWILQNCPFSEKRIAEAEASSVGECLYVAMLAETPVQEAQDRMNLYASQNDEYSIKGREMYLLFHHSVRNSKLANNLHKLDTPSTVRNWKTLNKLFAIAQSIEND